MSGFSPTLRYEHVFAIIRLDVFRDLRDSPQNAITVTKIVRSPEEAENEVARLNRLNEGKGCIYFSQVTRLERRRPKEG